MSLSYRRDIDGLRAVAVLLVVIYHAGFQSVSGGFVGVDVFFVISGYLITTLIIKDINNKKFSLAKFYAKRIKRLLPVFYTVIGTTLIFGYFLLLPEDFDSLLDSSVASSLFGANIFFWLKTGGYFTSSTGEMPLLHLWSLAVEEQFYLLWPFVLLVFYKVPEKYKVCLLVIGVSVLFAFAEWAAIYKPNGAYYLLPTRAGELMLGGTVAFILMKPVNFKSSYLNVLSILGGGLILFPAFYLDRQSVFPGLNALIPCLGTAFLIISGVNNHSVVNNFISNKFFVFIGALSYSMYLWHWPIVAFLKYVNVSFTFFVGLTVIFLSLLLSYFSCKYIESPIRYGGMKGYRLTFNLLVFPLVCLLSFFTFSQYSEKSISLYSNNVYNDVKKSIAMPTVDNGWCYRTVDNLENYNGDELSCYLNKGNSLALLWGDSHAAHFQPLVKKIAQESNFSLNAFITSNCFPSLQVSDSRNLGGNPRLCGEYRKRVKNLVESGLVDTVFIAAKWDSNLDWIEETRSAIEFLANHSKHVYVLSQVPSFQADLGKDYLKQVTLPLYYSKKEVQEKKSYKLANDVIFNLIGGFDNVKYIDIAKLINVKSPFYGNFPMYYDDDHLNIYGSQVVTSLFLKDGTFNFIKNITLNGENVERY